MIEQQKETYGRPPRQLNAHNGFVSAENIASSKERGVSGVTFSRYVGRSQKKVWLKIKQYTTATTTNNNDRVIDRETQVK